MDTVVLGVTMGPSPAGGAPPPPPPRPGPEPSQCPSPPPPLVVRLQMEEVQTLTGLGKEPESGSRWLTVSQQLHCRSVTPVETPVTPDTASAE